MPHENPVDEIHFALGYLSPVNSKGGMPLAYMQL